MASSSRKTPKLKQKRREFLAPFMVFAAQAYEQGRAEAERGVYNKFKPMLTEIMEKGKLYIEDPAHDDKENNLFQYRAYRCFVKGIMKCVIAHKEKDTQTPFVFDVNGTYKAEHWKLIDDWMKKYEVSFVQVVFHLVRYLTNDRMRFFFMHISDETGNEEMDLGDEGEFNVIDRKILNLETYFGKNFFASMRPKKGKKIQPLPSLLIYIKFVLDSLVFGERTKTKYMSAGKHGKVIKNESYESTANAVECVYNAWEKFVQRIGLDGMEAFLGPVLFYCKKTGKFAVTRPHRFFSDVIEAGSPMKEGSREDNVSIEDSVPVRSVTGDESMGVAVEDIEKDHWVAHLSEDMRKHLHRHASNFVDDLYTDVMKSDVLLANPDGILGQRVFSKYQSIDESTGLPKRFRLTVAQLNKLKHNIESAKLQAHNVDVELQHSLGQEAVPADSSDASVDSFKCGKDCTCAATISKVGYMGENFPIIFESNLKDFIEKADEATAGREILGEVQLIFTNPNVHGDTSLNTDTVSSIVNTSAKLLREGGHAFIQVSPMQLAQYIQVFRSHGNGRTFEVAEYPFVFIPTPMQERGKWGRRDSFAIPITVFMVYVQKKTGAGRISTATKQPDIRWFGNIDSKYHACTNVVDGSLVPSGSRYGVGVSGISEILDRYTEADDYVVDFFCNRAWAPMACVTADYSRLFIGAASSEKIVEEIEVKCSNSLIYQVGKNKMTKGMNFHTNLQSEMVELYKSHDYAKRFHSSYGLADWLTANSSGSFLPRLSTIPSHLLDLLAIMRSDSRIRDSKATRMSPSAMEPELQKLLSETDPGELLRNAASGVKLTFANVNQLPIGNLRPLDVIRQGANMGAFFGLVFRGGWDDNKEDIEKFGKGAFEFDEYTIKNKSIRITGFIEGKDGETTGDVYISAGKHCPFRYARFVKKGANAKFVINRGSRAKMREVTDSVIVYVYATKNISSSEDVCILVE